MLQIFKTIELQFGSRGNDQDQRVARDDPPRLWHDQGGGLCIVHLLLGGRDENIYGRAGANLREKLAACAEVEIERISARSF
jgi:hypothetical protein